MATEECWTMSVPAGGKHFLGLGRDASYQAAKSGDLIVMKVGPKPLLRVLVKAMKRKMERAGEPEEVA